MKRTKNMIYVPSHEAHELHLCVDNNADVYAQIKVVKANLTKKMKKGVYDPNKAIEAWYYVAEAEAKIYFKEFGYRFTTTEKWTCAVDLEAEYREKI